MKRRMAHVVRAHWNYKICIIDCQLLEFHLRYHSIAERPKHLQCKHRVHRVCGICLREHIIFGASQRLTHRTDNALSVVFARNLTKHIQNNVYQIQHKTSILNEHMGIRPMEIGTIVSSVRKVVHDATKHLTNLWLSFVFLCARFHFVLSVVVFHIPSRFCTLIVWAGAAATFLHFYILHVAYLFMFYIFLEQIVTRCVLRAALRLLLFTSYKYNVSLYEWWSVACNLHYLNTKNKYVSMVRTSNLPDPMSIFVYQFSPSFSLYPCLDWFQHNNLFALSGLLFHLSPKQLHHIFKWNAACLGNNSCAGCHIQLVTAPLTAHNMWSMLLNVRDVRLIKIETEFGLASKCVCDNRFQ